MGNPLTQARTLFIGVVLGASGCYAPRAAMPHDAASPGRPLSAASQAERVFRLQNSVMHDFISQEIEPSGTKAPPADHLFALESHMIDDCSALNEAAGLDAMGASTGAVLQLRVLGSLSRCENSARALRAAMEHAGATAAAGLD